MSFLIEERRQIVMSFLKKLGFDRLDKLIVVSDNVKNTVFICKILGVSWIFVFDMMGEKLEFSGDDDWNNAISGLEIDEIVQPPSEDALRADHRKVLRDGPRRDLYRLADFEDIARRYLKILPNIIGGENMEKARELAREARVWSRDLYVDEADKMRARGEKIVIF